jgi:DNA-binding CsgD family transcriptional regulator
MQAMNTLYAAWAGTAAPAPAPAPHLVFPSDWPSHLYMRAIDRDAQLVRMSFYLGRLRVLTPSELEVARWANEGHSDVAIAALRQTSRHTVARQVSSLIAKLGLGSRLGLARIPELNAWAPPRPTTLPANENDASDSWLTAEGFRLEAKEIARIWREIASGQWRPIASVDIGAVSYTTLRRVSGKSVDWARLSSREREALDLLACGDALKLIAIKLGLAPSTLSSILERARAHMGFATRAQLLRAYCVTRTALNDPA